MDKKSSLINVASMIVLLNLGGKVLAFLRESIIASRLGTTWQADAYTYANQLSTITFLSVAAAILTALIPTFVEVRQANGKEAFHAFANQILSLLIILAMAVIGVVNVVTYAVGKWSQDIQVQMTSELVGILIISILLITITYVLIAMLQSNNRFMPPALVTYPFNLFLVIYVYFFADKSHLKELAWIMVIAWALQALVLVPELIKSGYRFKWKIEIRDPRLRHIGKIIVPIIFISLVHQNNVTIDGLYATQLGEGYRASINFANTIYVSVVTVLIYGIMTVAYPKISEKKVEGSPSTHTYVKSIVGILAFLLIPITIGFIVLGEDIVRLIYGRGEFGEESIRLTTTVLSHYAIGAIGFGLIEVLSKTYFANKRFLPPLLTVGIINLLNLLITAWMTPFGLKGMTLASSMAMLLGAIGFLIYYLHKHKIAVEKEEWLNGFKIISTSFIMYGVIRGYYHYMQGIVTNESLIGVSMRLLTTTILGVSVYVAGNIILKERNTWDILKGIIGEKRSKK